MTFKNEIWKSLVTEEVTSAYCSFGYIFGYGFQEQFSIFQLLTQPISKHSKTKTKTKAIA